MLLKEIIKILEKEYPKNLAYEWDNVGLLAGNENRDIKTVLVTLDITPKVLSEAIENGADLILSHHPLIFSGIKNFREDNPQTKMYADIIRNNIAVYSAHTNMDTAPRGINHQLATLFSLKNIALLEEETGLGRYGDISEITLKEFAENVKKLLKTPNLRVSGDLNKIISRVALGSGGCSDLIPKAIAVGADVMVTADVKYHTAIDADTSGIAVIDAGHYPTEIIATDMFSKLLENTGLKIIKSKNTDIFSYL